MCSSDLGLLGGLTFAAKVGWSPNALGMVLLGAVATIALVGVERHVAQPIFTPRVFRRLEVKVSIVLLVMSYVAFFGLLVAVPFFVVHDFDASARRAAEATMAIPIGLALVAPFSGRLRRRFAIRPLTGVAGLLLCGAILGVAVAPNGKVVAALLMLVGCAIGIVNTTTNSVVMSAVDVSDRGLASGTVDRKSTRLNSSH